MKLSKRTFTFLIGAVVIVFIGGYKIYSGSKVKPMDSIAARSKGSAQAKVQIIEFIDFECPACAFGAKTLKEYMVKYPQDIRVQVKYFPLIKPHRHAMAVALYSECAAQQGKFWEFHELLMPAQTLWSPLISADAYFQGIAKQIGLNMPRLNACLSSDEASKAINDDRSLGQSLGVQSTPSYFINNQMVVGVKSLEDQLKTYFPQNQ